MYFLKNASKRAYTLPVRSGPRGAKAGGVTLRPGGEREVPPWYLDELAREDGFRPLLERGELVVEPESGPIRRSASPPDARVTELEARVAELEAQNAELRTRAKEALEKRDARIVELEAQLTAARSADPKGGDPKSEPKDESGQRSTRRS